MRRKTLAFLALSHLITDINQGVLPALLPILISMHHLSYTAAAGLVFGTNITSSVVQPLFGVYSDKISATWLMPVGMFLAGCGLALAGFAPNYWLMFCAVAISGLGIAAFHPEAARFVNHISGGRKATGVSIFSTGGNFGFALGPIVSTIILTTVGIKGTLWLLAPVSIMAIILLSQLSKIDTKNLQSVKQDSDKGVQGTDDWKSFSKLTVALSCRSAIFWSLNTFLPLYLIKVLGQPKEIGNMALTILLMAGAIGTLIAGRLADRFGNLNIIRAGLMLTIPMLLLFVNITKAKLLLFLLVPMGLILFAPFSPMVVLGQSYLPNRMGLASGVTLGLAVSVGGIVAPVLGWLADHYGIQSALSWIVILPFIATVIVFTLTENEPIPKDIASHNV